MQSNSKFTWMAIIIGTTTCIALGADSFQIPHSFDENLRQLKKDAPLTRLSPSAINQGLSFAESTDAQALEQKIGSIYASAILESAITNQRVPEQADRSRNLFLWPSKPDASIFRHRTYQNNSLYLLEGASREIFIVGGMPAVNLSEFPSCVMVGNETGWEATGVVIGPRMILSAAHIKKDPKRVFFGLSLGSGRGVIRKVVSKEICDGYSGSPDYKNDLMLLLLDEPVPPFAAAADFLSSEVFTKERLRVVRLAGFGAIAPSSNLGFGVKRWGDVPVASPDCADSQGAVFGGHAGFEFVAGDGRVDTCYGDSGGPAYWKDPEGKWWLAGITSRWTKNRSRACGDGGIYVRPDRYVDWIAKTAAGWGETLGNSSGNPIR